MAEKYHSFEDLPPDVAGRLRKRTVDGEKRYSPQVPEGASEEEHMRALDEAFRNPDYSERELVEIVEAFTVFNNAVQRGLPNQLYEMFAKALDSKFAKEVYRRYAIWCGHHFTEVGKEAAQKLADRIKSGLDKRSDWDEEDFHREYFLNREQGEKK